MKLAVGFDVLEDYVTPRSEPPPCSISNDHVDLEKAGGGYRLDEWDWDETLAFEKSDILRTVNRNCDLITLLGGKHAAIIQLFKSIEKGELQLAKCLLKRDDLNMDKLIDAIGRNILHVAASCGNNLGVALAVRSGMDIDQTTLYGSSPLMLACAWGKEVTCDLLLDLGADPTIRDQHGRTALSMASNGLRMHLLKHSKLKEYTSQLTMKIDMILGKDMDDKWRQAILNDAADNNGSTKVGTNSQTPSSDHTRVSEKYNICLYKTVVKKTKESNRSEKL